MGADVARQRLIELEHAPGDLIGIPLRLSCDGHRRFEQYLAELLDWHERALHRMRAARIDAHLPELG
jgi:hypothetical protein